MRRDAISSIFRVALRKALAKRRDRLEARYRTLRVIGRAIGLETNPK